MISRPHLLGRGIVATALAIGVSALCACGSSASTPTASSLHATTSPTAQAPTPFPTATPTPDTTAPTINVLSAGAAAGGSGTEAVAVIANASTTTAAGLITVTFTATSANGSAPVTTEAIINNLAADETQVVAAQLSVPSSDTIAKVTATATAGGTASYTNALVAGTATFNGSGISPTVNVSVKNNNQAVMDVTVGVACFDAGNKVVGGGQADVGTIAAGASKNVNLGISATTTPDHCLATAHPS